ncbi:HPr kinase/phosphorylase [Methylocapsa palsarum]|uniref:HPr Serine kinase C-terminal domain-containing protein n=1 Tax=Methylocapsa palsarum TaxID=1612308 RepID=A0A1I3VYL6_9HYPH|nr:HPr kinase/phosphatase C-terminal domain-containing protein [Methylocapsa palsarum]SFK00478.1 HPr Serine kinase C-terminal domain-containing protein [Methylocapsa palsarum]
MSDVPQSSPRQAPERGFIHATAVVIAEAGVLIRGASGAGKSSLALALIGAAETAGLFARLVGDDRIELRKRGARLIARGHSRIEGKIERRGEGILRVPVLTAAVVRLLIDLVPAQQGPPRYPEPDDDRASLEGVELEHLSMRQETSWSDCAATVLRRLGWLNHSCVTCLIHE